MDAVQTPPVFSSSSAAPAAASEERKKPVVSSDFDTFLRLMTTQIQNQDPLNPMDSAEYSTQLATFSGVEQQVLTNDLLESLVSRLGGSGIADLASWVGMEARVEAPANFAGAPVAVSPSIDPAADAAQLVVRNAGGTEIFRGDLPLTGETVEWAGVQQDGVPVPYGLYSFHVENFQGGKALGITGASTYARITEARTGQGGEVQLILEGGAAVSPDGVTALREAGAV